MSLYFIKILALENGPNFVLVFLVFSLVLYFTRRTGYYDARSPPLFGLGFLVSKPLRNNRAPSPRRPKNPFLRRGTDRRAPSFGVAQTEESDSSA